MARAGNELYAQPLDVVVRIAECVDLQLAAIARAGIDLPDRQRLAKNVEQFLVDARDGDGLACRAGRRWLSNDAGAGDLSEDLPHMESTSRALNS
ncbi:hypothetical protein AWV79_26955 [Cupriavidus sp. UYMMa02A]|nr:hypothetical protein AWV79_26955 [Cupriavidus sp. UYMMa02A]